MAPVAQSGEDWRGSRCARAWWRAVADDPEEPAQDLLRALAGAISRSQT